MDITKIGVNLGIPGKKKDVPVWVPLTLTEVITWIENKSYDEATKGELIKMARHRGQALREFVNNINRYVASIQKRRKASNGKEEGGGRDTGD